MTTRPPPSTPRPTTQAQALARAEVLHGLDAEILEELAVAAKEESYRAGARIVSELEAGADVYVMTAGEAEISVDVADGVREVLGRIGPGATFGEMSSLTGELRSATVTALGDVSVLILADADFDRLRERRPEVALRLLRSLATRLAAAEETTKALFASAAPPEKEPASAKPVAVRRGSVARVWRELVVSRGRDLPFLTLAAFVLTLVAVRASVFTAFHFDFAPREVLRAAYLSGFALLIFSACASLLTFRPGIRRAVAIAYGVGLALILNELGVTLAFDIFFKDIHTADPDVPFDIERLYRRAEPLRMIAIGFVVLIQAAYLRGFYRRAFFVAATRLRKLVARS
jgi:CRP-like cAMP-binding protein